MEFLYELKLRGSSRVFADGFSPGVLVSQIVSFDGVKEDAWNTEGMFVASLLGEENAFIKKYIEVVITPLEKGSL